MFIFCFALLQNCDKIETVDNYLYHIFTLFNIKQLNDVCLQSILTINRAIKGTELNKENIFAKSSPSERDRESSLKEIYHPNKDKKTIKEKSPFSLYYSKKINSFKGSLIQTNSPNFAVNEFYCPKIFEKLANQLYLLPVWSGIMISRHSFSYSVKTRLSNNPVENWFGQLKNNILTPKNIVSITGKWDSKRAIL